MSDLDYSEKVSALIHLGQPADSWLDYPTQFGLSRDDIPELIRMATDEHTWEEEPENPAVFRTIHAWRALGQLRAIEAVPQLLSTLRWVDDYDDDWTGEDLPRALALIGPEIIPQVAEYLADAQHKQWARVAASTTLASIVENFPETRSTCITAISDVLAKYNQNDETLNSCLVTDLANLKAVEAAPLVEQAFQADRVDVGIMGDWEDFQVEVGLLKERLTPLDTGWNPSAFSGDMLRGVKKEDKKTKNKRKQEKLSRKKNRKKKRK